MLSISQFNFQAKRSSQRGFHIWKLLKIAVRQQFWKGSANSNDAQSPQKYKARISNIGSNAFWIFKSNGLLEDLFVVEIA